jgi:hypothetical protein
MWLARARTDFFTLGDFRAFYCSARVALAGDDPYRAEPLGACERATAGTSDSNVTLPAPIPAHAMALFVPLEPLSFGMAAAMWCALLTAVFFFSSIALARLSGLPYGWVLAALFPLGLVVPIEEGQLVPLSVALLAGATLALRARRDGLGAVLAAAATIEPHIGLPACVAISIARPRARVVMCATTLVLFALGERVVGLPAMLEYVQHVLPEHIAAEARFDDQYSLTYLLSWLRVPLAAAIALGMASYWLAMLLGIGAGVLLSRRYHDVRWLVFVPAALSVCGGPFLHEEHLLAAVPLALLLAASASHSARISSIVAAALVAWPAKFAAIYFNAPGGPIHVDVTTVLWAGPPLALADVAWGARIAADSGHLPFLLVKFTSWIGLSMLVFDVLCRLKRRGGTRDPGDGSPPEDR